MPVGPQLATRDIKKLEVFIKRESGFQIQGPETMARTNLTKWHCGQRRAGRYPRREGRSSPCFRCTCRDGQLVESGSTRSKYYPSGHAATVREGSSKMDSYAMER